MPFTRPAQPIVRAAQDARDRLLYALKPMKGEDAKNLRRAVSTVFNAIMRFHEGDLKLRQPMPSSVQKNPTTEIERKVMAYWKAMDLLQDRVFGETKIPEEAVIRKFNMIT